jgi:hypothetical protein
MPIGILMYDITSILLQVYDIITVKTSSIDEIIDASIEISINAVSVIDRVPGIVYYNSNGNVIHYIILVYEPYLHNRIISTCITG